jgi:hypothetical protein
MAVQEEEVRQLAYRLWEEAGRPEGKDAAFWALAESRVVGTSGGPEAGGPQATSRRRRTRAAPAASRAPAKSK